MKKGILIAALALAFGLGAGAMESHAAVDTSEVYTLVNDYRVANGLPELTIDTNMQTASEIRATEAAQLWSHTRPDGSEWWTVDASVYGENLGYGYSSARELVDNWIASPSHNRNLLEAKYSTVCVAVVNINGVEYVAQEFGR